MDLADVPRHRPLAFDKMELLIKEMQDPDTGVPVRSQKLFLTVIPSAFMGYDLVEWLMERFNLDEASNVEAINLANQLCQYGYFFPVNDLKNLILKDDSSLYRFQSPYYWPWQGPRVATGSGPSLGPDNVEYAIYLVKRTLRNKQRHGLEEYEQEALANLKKNLAAKWDFITMQAEEQVRLAKERKKGDKIVSDSQERAYWRVARPPPGSATALDQCPVPVRARQPRPKTNTIQHLTREIEHLKTSLDRTRVKTSIALEALLAYTETFAPYDPWLTPPQPSNPWVSDDTLFWQINSPLVDIPSEKRVQRWALSIEELVSDPTGLQEFTSFLRKEYSHENIRFWLAVKDLKRSSTKQISKKLEDIYEEFLKPGAPCEINIDGATADRVTEGIRSGSRFSLDHAANHVYSLLLKKDCYPRFIRSDHFQRLLTEGKNVHQKKAKFFNFGGQVKKKPGACGAALSRRRGSDRSLSGSAHELAVCAALPPRAPDPPPHSHSQTNLCDIHYREVADDDSEVAPWESGSRDVYGSGGRRRQDSAADSGSSSSDVSGVAAMGERRRLPQQSTLDGGLRGAPPPLRRLSAVEPRHLAPLASPPHSPRAAPAPRAQPPHHPHPTPTISVSSAPDDDAGYCSPDERRSLAPSDEPSSVFATPTEPAKPLAGDPPRPTLSREPSTTKETSPASSKYSSSDIGELPVCAPGADESPGAARPELADVVSATPAAAASIVTVTKTDTVTSTVSVIPTESGAPPPAATAECKPAPAPSATVASADTVPSTASAATITPSASVTPHASDIATGIATAPRESVLSTATEASHIAVTSGALVSSLESVTALASAAAPATYATVTATTKPLWSAPTASTTSISSYSSTSAGSASPLPAPPPAPRAAPLAEGEDIGADDDHVDKVPSAPLQRDSADSMAASHSDATNQIAHNKDELSSVSESNIVKRDNNSGIDERTQRNDICPWEDENSCESDAPYVKTYATLGYL